MSEQNGKPEKEQLKKQVVWLMSRALHLQNVQSKEDFDPFSLSGEEIDSILAERELWIHTQKHLQEAEEDMTPTLEFLEGRIQTINGILKRLAN